MNAMVRFASPTTVEGKREFHRLFGGNKENVEAAVWAHLSDAMKSSGPMMSSSEHQSARRAEFNQLVSEQLNTGLYETRKVQRTLLDQTDEKGKAITVYATEVVMDEKTGSPKVATRSPLAQFGLRVTQFSITDVTYDEQTQAQFRTKKEAFLAAENSKAQREKEVQERLMVEEKGRREKAEAEALANRQKAKEVIDAQREKEVAELNANREKIVAETAAAQKVAVALQTMQEAETKAKQEKSVAETFASQQLEVAKLQRLAAEENKKAAILIAEGQKESLALGGAISERDRVLATIAADRDVRVAAELAKINTPTNVIAGGSGANGSSNPMENLINIRLLESMSVLKPASK
jgi:regulator of protease activity HflC (stomatin/prohibitin superfamily)